MQASLGCQLLDQGTPMDLVSDVLGHTNEKMTRRYAKRSVAKLTEELMKRREKVIKFKAKDDK
ncbi:MAG: hypothetical protein ACMUIU_06175 [bacterium]